MSNQEFTFHTWIEYDFEGELLVTHNEKQQTAIANLDGTIIVLQNNKDDIGPTLTFGDCIAIIVNQFMQIIQIQWLLNQEILLINTPDDIILWDIYQNQEIERYALTEKILFAKQIELGLLVVTASGIAHLFSKYNHWKSDQPSYLVADIENGVMCYPYRYQIIDGEWETEQISENRQDRRIRRRFESDNEISIKGEVFSIGEFDVAKELKLRDIHRHIFDQEEHLLILALDDNVLIRSKNTAIFLQEQPDNYSIVLPVANIYLFGVQADHKYYICRHPDGEFRILINGESQYEFYSFQEQEIYVNGLLPSMFANSDINIKHARIHLPYGYVWFPDFRDDALFIDLIKREGSYFQDIGHDPTIYIEISEDNSHLLDWRRGKAYPAGILYYRDILHPENEPVILYHTEELENRPTVDDFENVSTENDKFALIIPEWSKIELVAYNTDTLFKTEYSLSQYFFILNSWSQRNECAQLEYPDNVPDNIAYYLFGNLTIDSISPPLRLTQISPVWTMSQNQELLAFYSYDKYCYILDLTQEHYIPKYSFECEAPFDMSFSPDGQYLVLLQFELRQTNLQSHPSTKQILELQFPYLNIYVADIGYQKTYKRGIRFPIKIQSRKLFIDFEDDSITVSLPSYIDNSELLECTFHISEKKYTIKNNAEPKRFWQTYSMFSPNSRIDKGEEFPVENHPEIRRDLAMRPFHVLDKTLIRKSDNKVISSAFGNTISIPQQSTLDVYSLEGTFEKQLPFYYTERLKTIFIDKSKARYIKDHSYIALNKPDNIPSTYSTKLDLANSDLYYLKRNRELVKQILQTKEVHSPQGIAFRSPKLSIYQSQLELLLERLKDAIAFASEV